MASGLVVLRWGVRRLVGWRWLSGRLGWFVMLWLMVRRLMMVGPGVLMLLWLVRRLMFRLSWRTQIGNMFGWLAVDWCGIITPLRLVRPPNIIHRC
jgi:hypothetical protein